MLNVYIGYDPKESVAYHTLVQSIMDNSSVPVCFAPIYQKNISEYTRPKDEKASTEFSFSRFLVPYMNGFSGLAVFMDCDMLMKGDIAELFKEFDFRSAVQVVQHDYKPKTKTKFLNQKQTVYKKKNWSSVMLFNCSHYHCRRLTPEAVNTQSGLWLHQFHWTDRVGELSPHWNYLVGEGQDVKDPKLIHYTLGGPYFKDYQDCEFSEDWGIYFQRAIHCDQ